MKFAIVRRRGFFFFDTARLSGLEGVFSMAKDTLCLKLYSIYLMSNLLPPIKILVRTSTKCFVNDVLVLNLQKDPFVGIRTSIPAIVTPSTNPAKQAAKVVDSFTVCYSGQDGIVGI